MWIVLLQVVSNVFQLLFCQYSSDFLFPFPAKAADIFSRVLRQIVMIQAECRERLQEAEVIVTGKSCVVASDIDFVKQYYAEILVELVYIGDRDFFCSLNNSMLCRYEL